jgi:diadenosine tetraphosphate (Ap4A) HIT family hydrolase
MNQRTPFDVGLLRPEPGVCFICEFIHGNPKYEHSEVARTDSAIAFMNKYPTLEGYVLVAPLDHYEQVTGDISAEQYVELHRFVYAVAEAVRQMTQPERIYILSLGSQSANAHVHWHIAPLPVGVPLEQQQYHALMHENGALEVTGQAEMAKNIGALILPR